MMRKKGGKIVEKESGEVYASKAAMKKHEKMEPMKEMKMEYGAKKAKKKASMLKKKMK